MSVPEKVLGRIASIRIGRGGYQDAMFGVTIILLQNGSSVRDFTSVSDFMGTWDTSIKVTESTKWTELDRAKQNADMVKWLDEQCRAAHVDDVYDLKGMLVEITLQGTTLKSWRLLTEVL